jgi:hypothetical protein
MSNKVDTVNVVQASDTGPTSVVSFSESPKGNKEAEALFTRIVKENEPDFSDEDVDACLDNGYYEDGSYSVYICHSE